GYLHFTRSCYGLFYFNHILGVALNITIRHIKIIHLHISSLLYEKYGGAFID
ncbi:hypothetical protein ABH901_002679, partial [Mammaliicoccus lentus]